MNKEEILNMLSKYDKYNSSKHFGAKTLLSHIYDTHREEKFYEFLIKSLDYEGTLNDYLCDFCDIYECFPGDMDD